MSKCDQCATLAQFACRLNEMGDKLDAIHNHIGVPPRRKKANLRGIATELKRLSQTLPGEDTNASIQRVELALMVHFGKAR